ncbi:MAG TPA: methylated-DNA--[protein]-cysteine S-methyltransferase [Flavobacteriales bacterium]|nr:methylated-DNA--[protein]-cysteine S-methyltransferase [Flavobacteriales bacterium]
MSGRKEEFERITEIIDLVRNEHHHVPSVALLANELRQSPAGLDRLFLGWCGLNTAEFLGTMGNGHALEVLGATSGSPTLFDDLSAAPVPAGPAHDTFMRIEPMTEEEYADGGVALNIRYAFHPTPFGRLLLAATDKGVSYAAFEPIPSGSAPASRDPEGALVADLRSRFPKASCTEGTDERQEAALAVFRRDWTDMPEIVLHMHGTDFQLKVWRSLLRIPVGSLTTYRRIATELGMPQAARAVGTAIGSNPIAWLVPCHRVVRTSGELGGYMWGPTRKAAIMAWERGMVGKPAWRG